MKGGSPSHWEEYSFLIAQYASPALNMVEELLSPRIVKLVAKTVPERSNRPSQVCFLFIRRMFLQIASKPRK